MTCSFQNFDSNFILAQLNSELKTIYEWLKSNKIKVNCQKSNFMIYSYLKQSQLPPLTFGNNLISETEATKFLGIYIDKDLSFRRHVDHICSKISKSNGVLHRLKEFFPPDQLELLYHTLVEPHILYGIEARGRMHWSGKEVLSLSICMAN